MTLPLPLLTITDPDGNVMAFRVPMLTDDNREAIDPVLRDLLENHSAEEVLLVVAERIHDDRIYRRVAEQRGVLAL